MTRRRRHSEVVNILAVSDERSSLLLNEEARARLGRIDLLLGCGDLPYTYMEHLFTVLRTRHAYYVHGNHDAPIHLSGGRLLTEPGGWENVDGRSVYVADFDLLIAGLEGSIRYRPGRPYQYTQQEMTVRAQRLVLNLLYNRVAFGRYLDIFIAHAPPFGIQDGEDLPHQGFTFFRTLIQRFRPRLFLHGHLHRYGQEPWRTKVGETEVVNVFPFRLIHWREGEIEYNRLYRR